jgi:hypothetical protein
VRPNETFYTELRVIGFRLTLGTYKMLELVARTYDVVAWRLRRPRRDLNFPDVESLEEVEFLAPSPHCASSPPPACEAWLLITEHDERLME